MSQEPQGIAIDEPFPDEPQGQPQAQEDDAEPEGVVEVAPGRRMVDVSVVAAERKRARELTAKDIRDKEVAPLQKEKERADALQQALDSIKPFVDQLKRGPQAPPQAEEEQISDEQAATYARRFELYTPESTPNIKLAKTIMADHRRETREIAKQAATEAIGPLQAATAEDRSRHNFAAMAALKDGDGQPLVDPKVLAEEWVALDVTLTADPKVAEVVLERAIGKTVRKSGRTASPSRAPVLSESPGGRAPQTLTLTESGKKLGLTKTDLETANKSYTPGGMSPIGDWK